jgi:hypothetical protein
MHQTSPQIASEATAAFDSCSDAPRNTAQRSLSLTIYLNVTEMQKLSLKGHIATKDALKKGSKDRFRLG